VGLWGCQRVAGDANPPIAPKIARFVPVCTMEDIGTKDEWAPAQRVPTPSGVPRGMDDSTGQRITCRRDRAQGRRAEANRSGFD
jgi:hypothetical protein